MREFATVSLCWKYLPCWVVLFFDVSSREQTAVQKPQSSLDKRSIQVFLIASGKQDSPVALAQSELSVSLDKQAAQVETLCTDG